MADIVKIATRDSYGKALVEMGAVNDKLIVMDADLAAATKTAGFKRGLPFFMSFLSHNSQIIQFHLKIFSFLL